MSRQQIYVLAASPFPYDANSFYRGMGPWNYLQKASGGKVRVEQLKNGDPVSWQQIDAADVLFLHRPCRNDDLVMLKIAKKLGVPVIVDYDDWLFDVPEWNPTKKQYDNIGLQTVVATSIACADVVTVSTSALYDKIKPVNKNTVIVPNMYTRERYPYRADKLTPRNPVFAWRGTCTHEEDMLSVAAAWSHLPSKIVFWGDPTRHVIMHMQAISFEYKETRDPFIYMEEFYHSAPKVLLCPLVDCFFNRCKSNIAYQEALHAGAMIVAPDMPEWKRPGVINYKPGDSESFLAAAQYAIDIAPDQHEAIVSDAYEKMIGLYGGGTVNELRMQILNTVLEPGFEHNPRNAFDQLCGLWALGALKGTKHLPDGVPREALAKAGVA